MNIDWLLLTYLIIGVFALLGFFRGWWKEAVTVLLLAVLVLLLQQPDWAEIIINTVNGLISSVWFLVEDLFSFLPDGGPIQFDAGSPGTWIMVLILFLGSAALVSRLALPDYHTGKKGTFYSVTIMGRLLGFFLGALNGFLFVSLIREYLDGRALPGTIPPQTEIVVASSSGFGPASANLSLQAVNLPNFTILDSYIPLVVIGIGLLIFFAALKSRVGVAISAQGGKLESRSPYGYAMTKKQPLPAPPRPQRVEVVNQ